MGLIGFLWFLLSIVSLVGFVWLCVLAFRQHIGWGLAVFFLSPIAAIVFAIKHWQESKKPFLIYAGSTVGFFALVVYAFSAMGGFQMMSMAHRMSQGEEIGDEEAAQFMQAQIERMESSGLLSAEEEAELREMQQMIHDTQNQQGDVDEVELYVSGINAVQVIGAEPLPGDWDLDEDLEEPTTLDDFADEEADDGGDDEGGEEEAAEEEVPDDSPNLRKVRITFPAAYGDEQRIELDFDTLAAVRTGQDRHPVPDLDRLCGM